jgi:hypothetical protein
MKVGADSAETGLDSGRRKSQPFLETIFPSDRQQFLQSAGRQVLQALYPIPLWLKSAKFTLHITEFIMNYFMKMLSFSIELVLLLITVPSYIGYVFGYCALVYHLQSPGNPYTSWDV